MSSVTFKRMGDCQCSPRPGEEPHGVLVRLDGDPGDTEYGVSITCASCGRIVWIEKDSELVADEIPMALIRTVKPDGHIFYELVPVDEWEAEQATAPPS